MNKKLFKGLSWLVLALMLVPSAIAGTYSRTYSFTDGTTAYGSQVAAELDALGSSVNNIVNAQISSGAAIADSKLAQITTPNKVKLAAVDDTENIAAPMGTFRNLKVVRNSVTQVTVTASELTLQNENGESRRITGVNEAIAITTSGAGGLDTGAEGNKWYYIWIIRKSTDGTVDGLLSASSTSPTLPAGYDQYALVSAVHNTAGDFVDFIQEGNMYTYATHISLATGSPGTTWQTIDITEYCPAELSTVIYGELSGWNTTGVTNDSSVAASNTIAPNKVQITTANDEKSFLFHIKTANTLYWLSDNSGTVYLGGFILNKLS